MPQLVIDILMLVSGVALLIAGGETLVRGAGALARRLGVPLLIVGLTVVAFGTSAPELALNIIAAINENTGLSFGNVIGSNIANVGLILGIAALIAPLAVHASVVKREIPVMVLASGATVAMGLLTIFEPSHVYGQIDGVIFLIAFVLFIYWTFVRARASRQDFEKAVADVPEKADRLSLAVAMVVIGLLLLAIGGNLTERSASSIAAALGMSDEMIGLTVVALATSLPELVTCVIAVRKGQADIAVGNVVGSNIFNLLLVFGVTALIRPIPVPPIGGAISLFVMLGFALVLIPMSCTPSTRLSRVEGGVLLAGYLGYMVYEIWGVVSGG